MHLWIAAARQLFARAVRVVLPPDSLKEFCKQSDGTNSLTKSVLHVIHTAQFPNQTLQITYEQPRSEDLNQLFQHTSGYA